MSLGTQAVKYFTQDSLYNDQAFVCLPPPFPRPSYSPVSKSLRKLQVRRFGYEAIICLFTLSKLSYSMQAITGLAHHGKLLRGVR